MSDKDLGSNRQGDLPTEGHEATGVVWQSINLNDRVRVRLTDIGREHHRKQHEEVFAPYGDRFPYTPPKVDADGWSEFQHWQLMQDFGPKVGLGMNVPFETTIQIAPAASLVTKMLEALQLAEREMDDFDSFDALVKVRAAIRKATTASAVGTERSEVNQNNQVIP